MFDFSQFMPHGHCYLWRPEILWLHAGSDALIAAAYFSIPLALIYFVSQRSDIEFKWMFVLFGLFISFCGLTHMMAIYTIWVPNYGLEGLIKAATALISVATAILLWPLIPQALRLPRPGEVEEKNRELEVLNRHLEEKVAERVKDSERLAAIVSHSHDAILSKTLDGRVLSWNKAAESIFKYSAEEMIGHLVLKIVPPSKHSEEADSLRRIQAGLDCDPYETLRITKDGEELVVSVSMSPIRDKEGHVIAASSIIRDVTQKHLTDAKLSETSLALKDRNQQLINLNKAKDEFIANLSHELRNPLNIIIGYSELIESFEAGSQELKSAIETIRRNARTQLHLVEDLLDMSRIVSGKFSLNVRSSNADEVVENAIKAVAHAAKVKNITIEKNLSSTDKSLVCDPDRIQQVLWNLLSNAIKFSGNGGQVGVKSGRVGADFVFEVSDTGPGIAANELPHIFDRLWQSDHLEGEKKNGLGLGLRIAKDLVEAHGGDIKAFSDGLGKGSRFQVSLPIQAVSLEDIPSTESPRKPLEGLDILVVDDTQDAVDLVRVVLERAGAHVLTAFNGAEALEIVQKNHIHLIISDINMPVMNGYVFMENARRLERERGLTPIRPAIALTARSGPGEKERAYQAGFQLHLIKPVRPGILVEKVLDVIGRNHIGA